MNNWIIKWLPLVIMLSTMCMPFLINMMPLPKVIIPMLLVIWVSMITYQYDIKVPKSFLTLFAFLLLSQTYLALTNNTGITSYIVIGMIWFGLALLIWLGMHYVSQHAETYYSSFLLAALLWLIVSAIVWLGWTDDQAIRIGMFAMTQNAQPKPAGPFANGNVFGILMVCAWLISTYFYLHKPKHKAIHAALSFLFLMWVFVSMSRGAWLAWLPVFMMISAWLIYNRSWKTLLLFVTSAVLAWLLASALIQYMADGAVMNSRAESVLGGFKDRLVLYPSVFEVWKEHWLLGVGLGNLGAYYLTGQAQALTYLPEGFNGIGATTIAHNHLLQLLAEAGLVGLTLWLLVSFGLFKSLWRCGFNVKSKAWLPLNIALVLWIQGLVNISMVQPIPFFMFFLFLGLGMALLPHELKSDAISIRKPYMAIFATILVLGLAYQSNSILSNWRLFGEMIQTAEGQHRGELISKLMPYEQTYPVLMRQILFDMLSRGGNGSNVVRIQEHMLQALAKEQWPMLYQGLFYSYLVQKNWVKACETAVFIEKQHWSGDVNKEVYAGACRGENTGRFVLGS